MSNYPSRFDRSKNYTRVMQPDEVRHAHSHDINDAQLIMGERLKRIADTLISDGDVIGGGALRVDPVTGSVNITSGSVYAGGEVHDLADGAFTIPVDQTVTIGICVTERVVTYLEDTTLMGEVTGTRAFGTPGADRLKSEAVWTWSGAGTCSGRFFGVYTVVDGVPLTQLPPPALEPINNALARYDRESNGHYIVNGWRVSARGYNPADQSQVFSVEEGTINVWGYKLDRLTAYPLKVVENPDLLEIGAEPHQAPSSPANPLQIFLNKGPIAQVISVLVVKQVTETITHGPYTGISDPLQHSGVSNIVSVVQGGTTFIAGTDYALTADQVNWSPAGAEPAPGSTYQVTYQYLTLTQPDSSDRTSIWVSNVTPSSTVIVHYTYKLPRIDVITVDRTGAIGYVPGKSSPLAPLAPPVADDVFAIAQVTNNWGLTPTVANTVTRTVHTNKLQQFGLLIDDLFDLVAQEKLKNDINVRDVVAKRGLAVDPFRSDALRDAGIAQTAAVVDGTLQLPIAIETEVRAIGSLPLLLPWTEETIVAQELTTGCKRINPYQAFDPLPPLLSITPAIDFVVETASVFLSDVTNTITQYRNGGTHHWHSVLGQDTETSVSEVSSSKANAPFLRQRTVAFTVTGFGHGETLTALTFDGIDVTPPGLAGDVNGVVTGTFTIPANIAAGTKTVVALGGSGARAQAAYSGSVEIDTTVFQRIYTTTIWIESDPLAETCTLADTRQITSLDVKFCAIGNRANDVFIQVREVQYGVPTRVVAGEGRLSMAGVAVDTWVNIPLSSPVNRKAGVEYALVLLTDDAYHAVSLAELGQFDATLQRWVTAQPYNVGVLLSSSNQSTWTPHQSEDLTFRLKAARFTANTRTIDTGPWVLANVSDLVVLAGIDLPTDDTSVQVLITRASGATILAHPNQLISFSEYVTETVNIKLVLTGTAAHSPVVYPIVQLLKGTLAGAGTYASRAMVAGASSRVLVTLETLLPGSASTIDVKAGQTSGAAVAATLINATPLGDGWQERTYELKPYALADVRVFLALAGSPSARPQVRQLRARATDIPPNITGG